MGEFGKRIDAANQKAVEILKTAQPVLEDVRPAKEVVPGMDARIILHAGPPIAWERMCGPVKGAIVGAILYEGWAKTQEEAWKLAESGKVIYDSCHHHNAVGPMAGILSPSMPVFCVKNQTQGNMGYCSLNEGLGKVLRFGANGPEVIERLKWMENILGPALQKAVKVSGGINVKSLTAQALLMGDECHNRNVAASSLFIKEIIPHLLATDLDKDTIADVVRFISGNVHFFLNLSMAACKATTDPILGIPDCSLVATMGRNGTDIGIRIAGLGNRWFVAPSGQPKGLYFSPYTEEDANPDLGDSTVSEVAGIGGFAMASAPAIVKFVGGTPADAIRYTREMYEISVDRHQDFQIPNLNFMGSPVGVDIRKVVETGITPIINTGIAHKEPGVGQIGAGLLYAPIKGFEEALMALHEQGAVKA